MMTFPTEWTNNPNAPNSTNQIMSDGQISRYLVGEAPFFGRCFLQGATVEVLIEASHHLRTSP
jgi:hypothetical protein